MTKAKLYIASVGYGVAVIYLYYKIMFQRKMEYKCIKVQEQGWLGFKIEAQTYLGRK